MAPPPPTKYQPLAAYLAGLPPGTDTVTLTFPEIEALLGAPLPYAARRAGFWANPRREWAATPQARAWLSAGWRMAGVRWAPDGGRVATFVHADMTDARNA